jgi:hypothetical protein
VRLFIGAEKMDKLNWKKYPDKIPLQSYDDNEIIILKVDEKGRRFWEACNYNTATKEFYRSQHKLEYEDDSPVIYDNNITHWIDIYDLPAPQEKHITKITDFRSFKQEMLSKIDNKEEIFESELLDLITIYEVAREVIMSDTWLEDIRSIVALDDRYFAIEYTHYARDDSKSCTKAPYEVLKVTKTVTATDWTPVGSAEEG